MPNLEDWKKKKKKAREAPAEGDLINMILSMSPAPRKCLQYLYLEHWRAFE